MSNWEVLKMKTYKHSYKELHHIGRNYLNDGGFCSVIATCVATGQPFSKVYREFKAVGRRRGDGTTRAQQNKVLKVYGKTLDVDLIKTRHYKTLAGVSKECSTWGKGTYWVYVRGHVAAVRDGVLEDWSAESKSCKRVLAVLKVNDA